MKECWGYVTASLPYCGDMQQRRERAMKGEVARIYRPDFCMHRGSFVSGLFLQYLLHACLLRVCSLGETHETTSFTIRDACIRAYAPSDITQTKTHMCAAIGCHISTCSYSTCFAIRFIKNIYTQMHAVSLFIIPYTHGAYTAHAYLKIDIIRTPVLLLHLSNKNRGGIDLYYYGALV